MRRLHRYATAALLLAAVFTFTGCPNEEVAKQASTELIRVQEEENNTLAQYFANSEEMIDRQFGMSVERIDAITAKQRERFALKIQLSLADSPNALPEAREAIIQGVMAELEGVVATNERYKREIAEIVIGIREFHQGFLADQAGTLQAAKQLNDYVQLGSGVSRLILERTIDKLKEKASGAVKWISKATAALNRINTILKPGKAVAQ